MIKHQEIVLPEFPRGFHLITSLIERELSLPKTGLLQLMMKHTSAGITINENYDPSVRADFNAFFDRLVPENQAYFQHTMEGADDMPAHIKASLIGFNITIPIQNGNLLLGTWQGIYLAEFRNFGGQRSIVASILT